MKQINFIPIDMEIQSILKARECYFKLYPDYMEYQTDFDAETQKDPEDKMLGSEEQTVYYNIRLKRLSITAIEKSLTAKGRFCIAIAAPGVEDLMVYYSKDDKKKWEADMETLSDWIFFGKLT